MRGQESLDRRADDRGDWLDETFAAADHELAAELRRAIDRHELELVFEPVVALASGAMVGAETRVRWRHRRRGLLRSEEFLPLAERTGLSLPLGEWLIEQACRRLAFWQRTETVDHGFWLSVDLTKKQLDDPGLPRRLAACSMDSGCRHGSLVLELTERWPAGRPGMVALPDVGIRLAVDGFGAGCSSIALLRELAPELIKIDRSFVRGVPASRVDTRLVRSLLVLGEAFGAIVVAEGVETRAQADCLRRLGCELGQGFYLSPPLSEAELLAFALASVAA